MSAPATYHSGTPRNQHPAVARWHTHLRGLATAIHEISGLGRKRPRYRSYCRRMSFDRFQHFVVILVQLGCCTHFPTDLIGNLLSQILLHRLSSLKTPRQGDRLCLKLYCAELSVQLGAGFSLFYISNIEYRTRNFEQQKFLKE